jgi:transposase
VAVEIDQTMVEQASRWDGLKGYLTNTQLPAAKVMENYGQLWHVEKAFRISKTDLRIRPMYHRRRRRIEAHVLVAFVAYTIYKELERRLREANIPISPARVAELTQTMYEMSFTLPDDPHRRRILLQMDDQQRQVYALLH